MEQSLIKPAAPERRRLGVMIGSYFAAYLYVYLLTCAGEEGLKQRIILAVFTVLFLAGTELVNRDKPRTWESVVWLACTLGSLCAVLFTANTVWGFATILFLHGFAVYYALVRSGCLTDGRSGGFFPVDVFRGTIPYAFSRFTVRFRSWRALTAARRGRGFPIRTLLFVLLALALSAGLFAGAVSLLGRADDAFGEAIKKLIPRIDLEWFYNILLRFALSIPVGMYLCGLLLGAHDRAEECAASGPRMRAGLEKLRRVPGSVWIAVIAVFCALYLAFLVLQGSYLFGAFAGRLPEGFTVAGYARQGFFEMCRVTVLNFALLLLTQKSSEKITRTLKVFSTMLLAASALLAVTAVSKLGLYLHIFGLTPKRIASTWFVCVLLLGCVLTAVHLWTGKRTFRAWLLFAAVSLTVTMFITIPTEAPSRAEAARPDEVRIPVALETDDAVCVLRWEVLIDGKTVTTGGVNDADGRTPLWGVQMLSFTRWEFPDWDDLSDFTLRLYLSDNFVGSGQPGISGADAPAGEGLKIPVQWGGVYPVTVRGSRASGYTAELIREEISP